jgi:hypothetical protein
MKTRGDNNRKIDSGLVTPQDIVGRVVTAHRGNTSRKVTRGWRGQLSTSWIRIRRGLYRVLFRIASPVYHWAVRRGIARRVLHIQRPMLVRFGDKKLRLLSGGKVVGAYFPGCGWKIKPQFRLMVDEKRLPRSPAAKCGPCPGKSAPRTGPENR